jgi:hypothetical protein
VQAEKMLSEYFHQVAKYRWVESIQKEVEAFVRDDFVIESNRELREDQIDPVLLRLFYQLKLYMQTVMFEHFESALRDYTRFLLSFVLRDADMRNAKIVQDVTYNPFVRLSLKENARAQLLPGEVVNDTELIPLQRRPMIKVACLIDDVEVPGKLAKKQKVVTQPELEKVSQDLYSIVPGMHGSLQEIERVDGIVFPLLLLEDRFLVAPDAANDERLKQYIRIIGSLIEASLRPTKKEIQNISAFMTIFEKR